MRQVNAAARIIHNNVHPDANIIVGALVDERCGQQVSVTVLATGFEVRVAEQHKLSPGGCVLKKADVVCTARKFRMTVEMVNDTR